MKGRAEFLEGFPQRAGILFNDTPCLFGTPIIVSSRQDFFWWRRIAGHGASVISEPKSRA